MNLFILFCFITLRATQVSELANIILCRVCCVHSMHTILCLCVEALVIIAMPCVYVANYYDCLFLSNNWRVVWRFLCLTSMMSDACMHSSGIRVDLVLSSDEITSVA